MRGVAAGRGESWPLSRLRIGSRLTLCFAAVVLLMGLGSGVGFWQLYLIRDQAQRLYQVDLKAQTVLRVHADLLALGGSLESLLDTRELDRFVSDAVPRRKAFLDDAERAIQALASGPETNDAALRTLEAIRIELPAHFDAVVELAGAGDWEAVRRRLEYQVKSHAEVTGALVEAIDREVRREQADTLRGIREVQRGAVWTLSLAGLLTLILASVLGVAVTRSITGPLARLDAGAQALALGDFQARVAVSGVDELAKLGAVFNESASRLRGLYAALSRSEEHFRSLIEHASDLIMVLARDGTLLYVSPSCRRVLGYEPDARFIGKPVFGFILSDEAAERLRRVFVERTPSGRVGTPIELPFLHADGFTRVLEAVTTNLLDDPAVAGVVVNSRDVTERKQDEKAKAELQAALAKAATEWELTFDSIETPMLILNAAGRIGRFNAAAREASGCSDLLGRAAREVGPGEPWQQASELAAEVARSRFAAHAQVHDRANGKTWEISAAPTSRGAGDDERVIVVARDATRMTELQETLRRSETLSAMGTLVAGVAHEVRNPLFSISANLDAFEARFGGRREYDETIALLRNEVSRLVTLMNDLLDFGKPAYQKPSPEPIDGVVAQAVGACASLARRSRVTLANQVQGGFGPVLMDRKRIAQVLQNLLENAIQHSPPGATVVIEAAEEVDPQGQPWVACSVADTGPGFGEADLPRIFEPFFTRRRGGTGLGLSIVQRIVHLHGGTIDAANRPHGGAIVTLKLPREQVEREAAG